MPPNSIRNRNPEAREFARALRRKSNLAERRLWKVLRDRRFSGFKFRRQYACGRYFLDFYCAEARLAVEVDGETHGRSEGRSRDQARDEYLASVSIRVLRFWNHQLVTEPELVSAVIWRALMESVGVGEKNVDSGGMVG
jgi:very-short-patch-repair endonuclease